MSIEKLDRNHFLIHEIVESYVEDWKAKSGQRDHQKRAYFYMSDVGKCDRATFYDFTCPEKKRPITAKMLMMFNAGNILHDDIQSRARKRGMVEAGRDIEYGLEDWAHRATGRLDFITAVYKFIETEKGVAVAEIKTKNPYNFGDEEPSQDEIDQVLWYIDRLKESSSESVRKANVLDYGFILYLDRAMISEPMPLCGWRIDYDEGRVKEIKVRFTALDAAISAGECPMRSHERDSVKCTYCRYESHCWEGIPRPTAPVFKADETIEPPEQELVESMAAKYIELKDQEKQTEEELEMARGVLMKYFKATGIEQITVNSRQILHEFSKKTELDDDFLFSQVDPGLWPDIARTQVKLIQQAIKEGKVDPEVFERAKIVSYFEKIRIKTLKGEKHADSQSL